MAPLSDNARGALLMVASMAGFACNDALVKLVSTDLGLFQAIVLRGLVVVALLGGLAAARGALLPAIAPEDRPRLALRTAAEAGATVCFLTALFAMPLANATAVLQSVPLTVTLGAALFLGERVGWRRWSAIAVGFAGMLVILRPGPGGFDVASVWALGAVCLVTLRDLVTRRFSRGAPSLFVAFATALAITLTGAVGAAFAEWRPIAPWHLAALSGAALFLTVGYVCAVMTMRVGEIGAVSPFRYTVLLWAMLLGWALFGDAPGAATLAGAGLVVGSGLYALRRERALTGRAGR